MRKLTNTDIHREPEAARCRTPAPASIVCKGCNREFFARSLPIHQKTCFQKNAFVDIVCAKCRGVIRSGRFHEHEQLCAGEKPQTRAYLSNQYPLPSQTSGEEKAKDAADEELNEPEEDGRVRCRKCGRGFTEDRIAKHQAICSDRPRLATSKAKYDPAKEAKRGAASPTTLRRRRSQTETGKPHGQVAMPSKVLNVSFQQQQQQQSNTLTAQVTRMNRSYDFGSHFSTPNENVRDRDKKRFDIVLRDVPQRQQQSFGSPNNSSRFAPNSSTSGLSATSLNLLASNVTSSANPLATSRFMTAGSFR